MAWERGGLSLLSSPKELLLPSQGLPATTSRQLAANISTFWWKLGKRCHRVMPHGNAAALCPALRVAAPPLLFREWAAELGRGLQDRLRGAPRQQKACLEYAEDEDRAWYGANSIQGVQCLPQFLSRACPIPQHSFGHRRGDGMSWALLSLRNLHKTSQSRGGKTP